MMPKLEQIVERIAFGEAAAAPARALGLYLSADAVYLAETRTEKGRLLVDHLIRMPLPDDGKKTGAIATINAEFMPDPAKVAAAIRQSMAQLRWSTKRVHVTLSHHLGLLRYFTMPAIERRFLKTAVPIEAKKCIPIPFESLARDFAVVPLPPDAGGKPRAGVLIAATVRRNVDYAVGLTRALGLTLAGLEVAPCSVLRLWQAMGAAPDGAPFLHVHIDGGNVRIMLVDRGRPVFFREVFLGQQMMLGDLRRVDLPGCLAFAQKQLELGRVSHLRVSGSLASLPEFADAFARETGLRADRLDMPRQLSIKSGDWGGYAALGASVQAPAGAAPALDLAAFDRVTDEEKQTARDILIVGAAAALLLAGAGGLKAVTYSYRSKELRRYSRQLAPDVRASIAGLGQADMDQQLKDMQAQLNQLRGIADPRLHLQLSATLREIVASLPDKAWLDRVTVSDPLTGLDKPTFSVLLHGHAQDSAVADEQALAFQFKENLIRNPLLGKTFVVSLSLSKTSEAAGGGGLDPRSLAAKLEDRTQFTVELRAKR